MLKLLGVIVGVFIVWCIGAFFVSFQLRLGQTYDPSFGAWFMDPAKEHDLDSFTGGAIFWGILVALGAGVLFWVKQRFDRLEKAAGNRNAASPKGTGGGEGGGRPTS